MDFLKYQMGIGDALASVNEGTIKNVKACLETYMLAGWPILTMGNGGSAAIAEHWACDHTKGIQTYTNLNACTKNLASNMSILTAIANDIHYDEVFSKQIEWAPYKQALVLVVSSSGSSPNIVKALRAANKKNFASVAFVGFDGGTIVKEKLADHIVHVKANNYGVVEDCHHIIMSYLSQAIILDHTIVERSELKL